MFLLRDKKLLLLLKLNEYQLLILEIKESYKMELIMYFNKTNPSYLINKKRFINTCSLLSFTCNYASCFVKNK